MSLFKKIGEFFFGPAVTIPPGKHPLDGPTKRAMVEPDPPPVTPADPPLSTPAVEVAVEKPTKLYEITPTEWPFPTSPPPQSEVVPATVKKPRKPRTPKKPVEDIVTKAEPVPMITAAPKARNKKK
jgi:hypothetical protein